jgi:hypothetical protein
VGWDDVRHQRILQPKWSILDEVAGDSIAWRHGNTRLAVAARLGCIRTRLPPLLLFCLAAFPCSLLLLLLLAVVLLDQVVSGRGISIWGRDLDRLTRVLDRRSSIAQPGPGPSFWTYPPDVPGSCSAIAAKTVNWERRSPAAAHWYKCPPQAPDTPRNCPCRCRRSRMEAFRARGSSWRPWPHAAMGRMPRSTPWEEFADFRPQVVLLDIGMPGLVAAARCACCGVTRASANGLKAQLPLELLVVAVDIIEEQHRAGFRRKRSSIENQNVDGPR